MSTNIRHTTTSSVSACQPQLFDDPPRMTVTALTNRARLLSLRADIAGNPKSELGRAGNMISLVVEAAHELNAPAMLEDAAEKLEEAVAAHGEACKRAGIERQA